MDQNEERPLRPEDLADMRRRAWLATRRPEHFRPWENVRPDGCCLSDAILELVLPSFRHTVSELLADEEIGFLDRSAPFRDHLWRHIWWRLRSGQLTAFGLELGTGREWRSQPRMFDDAAADFEQNRLTCCGVTIAAVRLFEAVAGGAPTVTLDSGKNSGRLDYRELDAPLVEEMERMIATGAARGPMDAADRLAPRAAGSQNHASKRARLLRRLKARPTNSTYT